jgi:hypothetical protein
MSQGPHDATPSWYGYQYQGFVALYHSLIIINDIADEIDTVNNKEVNIKSIKDKIKNYKLEIEWMEDFSIKKNDKYISFHQVKSGISKNPLVFDVIYDIFYKMFENKKDSPKGFIHLNKKYENKKDIKDFEEEFIRNFKSERKEDEFKYYEQIKNEIRVYNKYFSELDGIKEEISNELEKYYSKMKYKEKSYDKKYAIFFMMNMLDNFISPNDRENHEISFNCFIEFFDKTIDSDFQKDHQYYLFRLAFSRAYEYLLKYKCGKENCFNCSKDCKIISLLDIVNEVEHNPFKTFVRNISPDTNLEHSNNLPSDRQILNTIYEYLYEIDGFKIKDNNKITLVNNKKINWATTNMEPNNRINKQMFVDDIEKNKMSLIDLLYNADNILTLNLSHENIDSLKNNITVIPFEFLVEEGLLNGNEKDFYFEKYSKEKKIKLVSYSELKKELGI